MSSTKHHLNAKPNSLASATDLIGYRWFCVARSVRKAKHSIAPSVASKIKSKRLMTSREHTIYLLRNFLQFSSIICSFVSCVSGGSVDIGLSGVWFLVYWLIPSRQLCNSFPIWLHTTTCVSSKLIVRLDHRARVCVCFHNDSVRGMKMPNELMAEVSKGFHEIPTGQLMNPARWYIFTPSVRVSAYSVVFHTCVRLCVHFMC